jgi:lipopolysaccharide heptosyltransferase I
VFENILIIKPSSLGDVVHALPVLAKLRAAYPNARLSWLVGTQAAPVVESNPNLNEVFYFRRSARRPFSAARAQMTLAKRLRNARFDCVIDLQGLFRSAAFALASGAPRRIGLSNAREGAPLFYTDIVDTPERIHAVDRYLLVGSVMGFDAAGPEFNLAVPKAARDSIDRLLESLPALKRPLFALSVGARWQSKEYPAAALAEVGRMLLARFGGAVLLVGAPSSAATASEIEKGIGPGTVNLVGRTDVAELMALLARMDLFVTPDTGAMHIADALGTPLVAVFGPTDPARTGPYLQKDRVLSNPGSCPKAPCLKRKCADPVCMRAVTPEEILRRAECVLKEHR